MKSAKMIMLGWNEKLCGVASILLIRMAHAHSLSLINGLMVLKVCHTGLAISTLLLAFARILFVIEWSTSRWRWRCLVIFLALARFLLLPICWSKELGTPR